MYRYPYYIGEGSVLRSCRLGEGVGGVGLVGGRGVGGLQTINDQRTWNS